MGQVYHEGFCRGNYNASDEFNSILCRTSLRRELFPLILGTLLCRVRDGGSIRIKETHLRDSNPRKKA